jgi:hypothetical protein
LVEEETKQIRVYLQDWEMLNKYLSLLQVKENRRLTFADVIHDLLSPVVEGKCEEVLKAISRE